MVFVSHSVGHRVGGRNINVGLFLLWSELIDQVGHKCIIRWTVMLVHLYPPLYLQDKI